MWLTEAEAKALAAELDTHPHWRVEKLVFNERPPTWEVYLTHREHPHFLTDHCISPITLPGDEIKMLPMILQREHEATLRAWDGWQARKK